MACKFDVMSETFYISNESCVFTFDGCALQWRDNVVLLKNVIAADFLHSGNCCDPHGKVSKTFFFWKSSGERRGHDTIILHYAQCQKKNRLRKCSVKFRGDPERLSLWLSVLRKCLEEVSLGRPKKCLVFINPFSGRQNGVDLYMRKVKPLLRLANVETCVVVTRNRSEFEKVICSGIDCYDSILAVGGDGTVSDIVNSLIASEMDLALVGQNRVDMRVPKIKIPIAIIPCGSTDCVAYTVNGTRDIETNALYAIFGNRCSFDVSRVVAENGDHRFFVGVFTYGYLSDLLKESEKFRWMGPIRYNYAGLLTLVRSKEYCGQVDLIGDVIQRTPPARAATCPKRDKCKPEGGDAKSTVVTPRTSSVVCCIQECPDKRLDVIRRDEVTALVRYTEDKRLQVNGKYFLIACANISCSSELTPNGIAPNCVPGDGYMHVVLFQPNTFCDLYKIYSRLTSKDKCCPLSDLSFVTAYKAKQVKISITQKESGNGVSANCDGELFHHSTVTIRIHRGVIQFFTRSQSQRGNPGG